MYLDHNPWVGSRHRFFLGSHCLRLGHGLVGTEKNTTALVVQAGISQASRPPAENAGMKIAASDDEGSISIL